MALTPEDKKDVQGAMGKAMANKVASVTRDNPLEGKKAKFVGGRIELRSEKSARNVALAKAKEGKKSKYYHGDMSPMGRKEVRRFKATSSKVRKDLRDRAESD